MSKGQTTDPYQLLYELLPQGFLSLLHCHYSNSPAYLFTTDSASVLPDSGASWTNYIPMRHSPGFIAYALCLTAALPAAFGLGLSLQTNSPLHSPLYYLSLPGKFTEDDYSKALCIYYVPCPRKKNLLIANTIVLTGSVSTI